jgi:pimeloyl-ACP methyl ester carboxylesterase
LETATIKILELEDQVFHTYTWEAGPKVILLVHGWESNASRWERLLPFLQQLGHTIIAIDAPAHGHSSGVEFNIPDYAKCIHMVATQYKPEFLIGHSLGGAACTYYQSTYQNPHIRKMILLGTPADLSVLIQNFVALLSLSPRMVPLLDLHFKNRFDFGIDDFSAEKFGTLLKLPGIIAHDIEDTVVLYVEARKLAQNWPQARLITTKGLGHSMHDDALYEELISFLAAQ